MNKTLSIVLVAVVIVLGSYFLITTEKAQAPSEEKPTLEMPVLGIPKVPEMIVSQDEETNKSPEVGQNIITYSDKGYSPSLLTIKTGDTVIFKNQSAQNMWTASAMHPAHILYSGTSLSEHCPDTTNTSFDACKGTLPGESWSFTFSKTGTWPYHDHLHPTLFGKIVVE